jgi:hypothetical protein
MKKPPSVIRRRAWLLLSDLSGRLLQAMAVRRHGCPMMMVAVMAEALHLFPNYGKHAAAVKSFSCELTGIRPRIGPLWVPEGYLIVILVRIAARLFRFR